MMAHNLSQATRGCIDGGGIRYTLWPAAVHADEMPAAVHLLAVSADSLLIHGARGVRSGVSIMLTVGAIVVAARVAAYDGARARLDIGRDDRVRLVSLLDAAVNTQADSLIAAHNDAAPVCRVGPARLASDELARAA